MTIQKLENGKVRLTPDDGKTLFCTLDKQPHSEAVVREENTKYFEEEDLHAEN